MHGQLRENGAVYEFDERTGDSLCAQGLASKVLEPRPAPPVIATTSQEKE